MAVKRPVVNYGGTPATLQAGDTLDPAALGNVTASTVSGTAGEALALTGGVPLLVYSDVFNQRGNGAGAWYRADNALTGPVRVSPVLGFALTSAAAGAAVTVQLIGLVPGFAGLTPGQAVWMGTAGGVVQSQPAVPATGAQVCSALVGYAAGATTVALEPTHDCVFTAYQSDLVPNAALSVEHFSDTGARRREVAAYTVQENVTPASLLAWWRFSEGSGTLAGDAVPGKADTGTLSGATGTPTWSASVPSSHLASNPYCLSFDPTKGQYVAPAGGTAYCPAATPWTVYAEFLVNGWSHSFYPAVCSLASGATGEGFFIAVGSTTSQTPGYGGASGYGGVMLGASGAVYKNMTAPATVTPGVWHRLAVGYGGGGGTTITNFSVTLDGAALTPAANPGLSGDTPGASRIGGLVNGQSSSWFDGLVGNVRVYNALLNSTQIGNLMNGYNEDGSAAYSIYDSPLRLGNYLVNPSAADLNVRFADAAAANPGTFTTFKNGSGASLAAAAEVIL